MSSTDPVPKLNLVQMPNLPGYSAANKAAPRLKSSGFHYVNGIRMSKTDGPSDTLRCMTDRATGSSDWATTAREVGSQTHRGINADIGNLHGTAPAYLKNSRQVLRYNAFFKEGVNESKEEQYRVRKAIFLFYLEDQTFEIQEPKQINSGIPQGKFLKRGCSGEGIPTCYDEIKMNKINNIYGRAFMVYGADDFTYQYHKENKCPLDEPDPNLVQMSEDKYHASRVEIAKQGGGDTSRNFGKRNSALKSFMEASLGNSMQRGSNTRSEKKQQFLQNDRRVLRFECEFDNTGNLYGDMMYYTLNYFLADDTVEIKEKRTANSGRDPFPLLLKRQKLPHDWMAEGNNDQDRGVEEDCANHVYVTPDEIQIGDQILVYGKLLKVVDCDAFTRAWYISNPQMLPSGWSEQPAPCPYQAPVVEPAVEDPPPYNGFGTHQDSLGSCTHLIPKVPKKDFQKFMRNDQKVLRFKARYGGQVRNEHKDSVFIIAYFLKDDSLRVFMPAQRNSGIVGGKFLQQDNYDNKATGKPFEPADFKLGSNVTISSHQFEVFEMDDFTSGWMDEHC